MYIHLLSAALLAAATIQPAPPRPDPLGHLVAEALRANLGLEQERLIERRALAAVHEARGRLLPSVGIEFRGSDLEGVPNLGDLVNPAYQALNQLAGTNQYPTDVDITVPPQHESRVRLLQPLLDLRAAAGYSAARSRHEGQRMELRVAARRLAAEVQLAYLREASARRVVDIYESSLTLVREQERVAERLFEIGRATPEATERARAERARVEQALAEGRANRRAAARALNRLLARPLDAPVETIPDSAFDLPLRLTSDAAVTHALTHREELRAVDAGERAAAAARRAVSASFMPNVHLALDYGFQDNEVGFGHDHDFRGASVLLSWNVLNGGSDRARLDGARYELERLRIRRRDLEDAIALEVRTAHEAATVAREAIATAEAGLVAARRTFELVRRRYEEGVATPMEFVDARTALTNAELNRVLTAYRYAMRWVDLERAAALREIPISGEGRP
ncbi:MAG TPA: TolC family protein [Gemmatimonadaceae bacterium]